MFLLLLLLLLLLLPIRIRDFTSNGASRKSKRESWKTRDYRGLWRAVV